MQNCSDNEIYIYICIHICVCICICIYGLPWWLRWERIPLKCGRPVFDPWVGKIPWRRAQQSTPVFLPGESPWTEDPGRLQSMGLQRKSQTRLSDQAQAHTHIHYMCGRNIYVYYIERGLFSLHFEILFYLGAKIPLWEWISVFPKATSLLEAEESPRALSKDTSPA